MKSPLPLFVKEGFLPLVKGGLEGFGSSMAMQFGIDAFVPLDKPERMGYSEIEIQFQNQGGL